jgi:hypothetical protein
MHLTTSQLSKFGSEPSFPHTCQLFLANIIISYAHQAAQFISVYGQNLNGPEVAWANRKYHGHQTLPPEMATKLKKEHKKKYGTPA